jgi:hypothetical protein
MIFLGDKVIDLFLGHFDNLGKPEKQVWRVITKNFNSSFVLESAIVFVPLLFDPGHLNSIIYFLMKSPRYILGSSRWKIVSLRTWNFMDRTKLFLRSQEFKILLTYFSFQFKQQSFCIYWLALKSCFVLIEIFQNHGCR